MDECGGATIRVLPGHVIDQIAAGEVVERPASVVKELVENALDAGAGRITVEVEGGGRRLIRVLDDGRGMTAAEARLALVRHATSKLRDIGDLVGIGTMGFRGEALPSIASVSRMTLTTRPRGATAAVRLEIEGGRILSEEEAGAPVGTQVEVRDLLWNVPARLKFMKGEATESAHVSEAVSRLAMAHPHVHLRLVVRGRTALEAPVSRDVSERVRSLLGGRAAERMQRVARAGDGVAVEAHLAAPEHAQSTGRGLHFFVGRRWVRDRGLVHAVLQGFGELVPRGRYPVGVVFLEVDGDRVDVNVHPQKLEVRFSDPQAVYAAVRHAVRAAVADAAWLGVGLEAGAGWSAATPRGTSDPVWSALGAAPGTAAPRATDAARDYAARLTSSLFSWRSASGTAPAPAPAPASGSVSESVSESVSGSVSVSASAPAPAPAPDPVPAGYFASLRFLGQLDLTYLVCEGDGELVLVDQHAAHERVAYQRLVERQRGEGISRQPLLLPETISLDRHLAAAAVDAADTLAAVGFEVEPFGEAGGGAATFALKAVPAGLRASADPAALLRQLLAELCDHGGSRAVEQRLEAVLATVACHSVVRAGDRLDPQEVAALLAALDRTASRSHCPHGRPVLVRVGVDELSSRFGRS